MNINEVHPAYGRCVMMRTIEGEPYRFFIKEGIHSMIPLSVLEMETPEK